MGVLREMPEIRLDQGLLKQWGSIWLGTTRSEPKSRKKMRLQSDSSLQKPKAAYSFDKKQGMDFGQVFDDAFGEAVATMLGNKVVKPLDNALLPPEPDVVEG